VEQGVERDLLREQVEELAPGGLLLGGVGGLQALREQVLDLLVGLLALPVHAGVGPHVAAVPPAHEQIGVVAEDGGVARGDHHVVGLGAAVDRGVDVGGLLLLEGHLDARGGEGLLDDRGALGDPVVVGAQHPEGGQARLGEEGLRLLGVERVDGRGLLVVRVLLLHEAARRLGLTGQPRPDDLLHVDRVEEGLAVPRVVEGVVLAVVEHREQQPEAAHGLDVPRGLQLVDREVGDRVDRLDRLRLQRVGAGRRIRDDLPAHGLGLRGHRTGVVVVALELHDLRGGGVVGHPPRAGADGVRVEGAGIGLDGGLRHDLHGREALGEHPRGVGEREGDGRVILLLDGLDEGDELGVQRGIGRVLDPLEGEDDVLRGDGRAVVEDRALAQGHVEGVPLGGGHLGGQGRVDLAGHRVQLGEALEGVPVDRDRERRGGGHRVVAVGAELVADGGVDVAVGVRLAGGGAAGVGTAVGAAVARRAGADPGDDAGRAGECGAAAEEAASADGAGGVGDHR
jgi:hypothetical protein